VTDYNSDQGRELRRARLTVVRPVAAKTHMPRAAFITEYKDPHILRRVAMTEVEETDRIMFCPACVQTMEGDDEFVEAHKLHVGYEEDPLRNYPALVNVSCKGCGWNEIIPIEPPKGLSDEEMKELNEHRSAGIRSGMLGQYHGISLHQQRQVGKSAMLAANYGMGAQTLQNMAAQMQQAQAAQMAANPPLMKYGQRIADNIWGQYSKADEERIEAEAARTNNASRRYMEQLQAEQSAQLARQVDRHIMDNMSKWPDKIKINPPRKYAVAPPPAPSVDARKDEMKQAMEIMVDNAPTEKHRESLLKKLKGMFE
jgi:hypothetical protein